MTYRERREHKAEKLREWAASREVKAAASFGRAHSIASQIPFGQPILVGHHSERHARRDAERIRSGMDKGVEHSHKADEMNSRAASIEAAADRAIYSDDPDAIEQLEGRVAELEAQRERIKAVNKEIRKGPGWSERITPPLTDREKTDLKSAAQFSSSLGYPSYKLSNLSGNLKRNRDRLALLQRRATIAAGILPA